MWGSIRSPFVLVESRHHTFLRRPDLQLLRARRRVLKRYRRRSASMGTDICALKNHRHAVVSSKLHRYEQVHDAAAIREDETSRSIVCRTKRPEPYVSRRIVPDANTMETVRSIRFCQNSGHR
jgi:hypothetical protein